MVFARSSIRASIWKLFPRQLLFPQTPGDCGRDAQLAHSLFKFLKNPPLTRAPCGHQGSEPSGIWGQWHCWESLCQRAWASLSCSLSVLQVAGCVPAGTAMAVAHARARLGCCSQSQALFEHEPEHHLHSVAAPVPTLTQAHLLLQQRSSPVFPPPVSSKCLGSFPPSLV